jgi:hypothetical protein
MKLHLLANVIAGSIVVTVSLTLLTVLLIKGQKTGALNDYKAIYGLLANMCFVWLCQLGAGLGFDGEI